MCGITDVHSHILPGLDDGSKSYEMSLDMLKQAYDQGVRRVFATPHLSPLFRPYRTEKAIESFKRLESMVSEDPELGEMEIHLGQEIFWCEDTERKIREGDILTMGGSGYVLLEYFPDETFYEITRSVRETIGMGYIPILAHVERFSALSTPDKVREVRGMGARLQMNYGSVSGEMFNKRASWCRKLLKNGLIDMMGTDMHDTDDRRPRTETAVSWMKKHLSEGYCGKLISESAGRIIRNERI